MFCRQLNCCERLAAQQVNVRPLKNWVVGNCRVFHTLQFIFSECVHSSNNKRMHRHCRLPSFDCKLRKNFLLRDIFGAQHDNIQKENNRKTENKFHDNDVLRNALPSRRIYNVFGVLVLRLRYQNILIIYRFVVVSLAPFLCLSLSLSAPQFLCEYSFPCDRHT